jgi:hypothetical protein
MASTSSQIGSGMLLVILTDDVSLHVLPQVATNLKSENNNKQHVSRKNYLVDLGTNTTKRSTILHLKDSDKTMKSATGTMSLVYSYKRHARGSRTRDILITELKGGSPIGFIATFETLVG